MISPHYEQPSAQAITTPGAVLKSLLVSAEGRVVLGTIRYALVAVSLTLVSQRVPF